MSSKYTQAERDAMVRAMTWEQRNANYLALPEPGLSNREREAIALSRGMYELQYGEPMPEADEDYDREADEAADLADYREEQDRLANAGRLRQVPDYELRDILTFHSLWLATRKTPNVQGLRADLSDTDLAGVDLTGANLELAILRGCDATGADFTDANLCCADLTEAIMEAASLTYADLRSATLVRTNLNRACLRAADLTRADLYEAQTAGADLTDAITECAILPRVNIMGVTG